MVEVAQTVEPDQASVPPHHSAEEILSHPRFPFARDEFLKAMLALYEHDPFLNRLLLEEVCGEVLRKKDKDLLIVSEERLRALAGSAA